MKKLSKEEQLGKLARLLKDAHITDAEYQEEESNIKIEFEAEQKRIQQEQARLAEEERIRKIQMGEIEPIPTDYNLEDNEHLYYKVNAIRNAKIITTVQKTREDVKTKDALSRGCLGGCLLGPLGALGGALTAKKEGTTTVENVQMENVQEIDRGMLLLTDKRVMFIGKNIVSLLYSSVPSVEFSKNNQLRIIYEGMVDGESYSLYGDGAEECSMYYNGIKELIRNKNKIMEQDRVNGKLGANQSRKD